MAIKNVSRAETFPNVDEKQTVRIDCLANAFANLDEAQMARIKGLADLPEKEQRLLFKLYEKKDPKLSKDLREKLTFYKALRESDRIRSELDQMNQEKEITANRQIDKITQLPLVRRELGTLPYPDLLFLAKRDKEQEQLIADIIL